MMSHQSLSAKRLAHDYSPSSLRTLVDICLRMSVMVTALSPGSKVKLIAMFSMNSFEFCSLDHKIFIACDALSSASSWTAPKKFFFRMTDAFKVQCIPSLSIPFSSSLTFCLLYSRLSCLPRMLTSSINNRTQVEEKKCCNLLLNPLSLSSH